MVNEKCYWGVTAPQYQPNRNEKFSLDRYNYVPLNLNDFPSSLACELCGEFTGNRAVLLVTYGCQDKGLRICKLCREDLVLLGMKFTQEISLKAPAPSFEPLEGLRALVLEVASK